MAASTTSPRRPQWTGEAACQPLRLFAMAAEVSSIESVLNLYVSVCAWGTGTKAQRVARVVQPILEDGALDALQRSFEAARPPGAALACHGRCPTVCRSGQCSSGRTFPDLVSEHVPVDSDVLRNRRLELMSVWEQRGIPKRNVKPPNHSCEKPPFRTNSHILLKDPYQDGEAVLIKVGRSPRIPSVTFSDR